MAWSAALGAVVLHATSLVLGESVPAAVGLRPLLALAYLAVAASALGYLLYFWLLDRLGALEINLVSYATAAVAPVPGWLLLGETTRPAALAGLLAIFAGFGLLKRLAMRTELAHLRQVV